MFLVEIDTEKISETVAGHLLYELYSIDEMTETEFFDKVTSIEDMERPSDIIPEHWEIIKDIILNDKWEIKKTGVARIKKATELIFDENDKHYNRETIKTADVEKIIYYRVMLLDRSYGLDKSVQLEHYEIRKGDAPEQVSSWHIAIQGGNCVVFNDDKTSVSDQIQYKVRLRNAYAKKTGDR